MTHIYIPKFKDHEATPIVAPRVNSLSGHFRLETFRGVEFPRGSGNVFEFSGTRRVRAEFENIITNQGLNQLGNETMDNTYLFHVGTGNTPETVFDTALETFVASQVNDTWNLNQAGTIWAQTTPPYYGSHQKKCRFAAGFGGGAVNITEVGISTSGGTGNCFSRALTVDGLGDPAAIPVDADEYLDIYYTLRNYPAHVLDGGGLDDGTGSIDISGTSYSYTIRCASATSATRWARYTNMGVIAHAGIADGIQTNYTVYGSDATLGAVTSGPASASTDSRNVTNCTEAAYVNDTFLRTIYYPFGLTNGNVTGGIKAMYLPYTHGVYQLLFDTPIPKTGSETMSFTMQYGWGRKTIP